MKRTRHIFAAVVLALAAGLAVAQNITQSGVNYQINSIGLGTAPTGTPGQISYVTGAGVVGDVGGVAAAAGLVGEVLQSTVVAASGVSQLTATPINVTSLSLTPGDWEVTGACDRTLTGVTATIYGCSLSGTTGTLSTQPGYTAGNLTCGPESLVTQSATWGTTVTGRFDTRVGPIVCRVVTAAATIFLVVGDTFSAGTMTTGVFGTIKARRVR